MAANATAKASCVKLMATTSHGIFQGHNPIDFSLSLLIVQIVIVLTITRLLGILLRPLRQPRVIAEIIGGILLGPSVLGKNTEYVAKLFPKQSLSILTTFANMGLMFFLFMVGLELDLASLKRTGKQAIAISLVGILIPYAAGVGVSFVLRATINPEGDFVPFLVFMGVALSITAFPVLARILAERRLLTTDVGKMAITAAAVDDVVAWVFLALAVALSGTGHSPAVAAWILLSGIGFILTMFIVVKPIMAWLARSSPDDQPVNELYVCIALGGVLLCGFFTDFIGIHGIFGAFVFGLIIPDGHFARALIEKIEDFVNILMLPLYFAASGLQTNIGSISGARSVGLLVLVIAVACGGKILGVLAVSMAYGEKFRKALTLGFLMNTKGLVELIVLNIGKERKVLNDEMFAIMVLMALFTTFITTPVVMALYKPARDQVPYKRRKLYDETGGGGGNTELRAVACVHGMRNVPSIMNLVETMRGTNKKEALRLYIMHLVELSERSSAIMMVQRVRRDGRPFASSYSTVVDGIGVAFGAFAQLNRVVLRSMTAIASTSNMHDDVCSTAAEKRAVLVVLPFHRTGRAEVSSTNPRFQGINQRIMLHAPCSVALLVDRGDAGQQQQLPPSNIDHSVAVVFFGGPDDREAAALGLRMAEHPGIKLTVFRFIVDSEAELAGKQQVALTVSEEYHLEHHLPRMSAVEVAYTIATEGLDTEAEAAADQECLEMVRRAEEVGAGDETPAVCVEEVRYADPVEAVLALAKRKEHGFIIVGRGRKPIPAVAAVSRRQQATYAELGPIADAIVAAEQHGPVVGASVIVVQQYDPLLVPGRAGLMPSPSRVSLKVSHASTP